MINFRYPEKKLAEAVGIARDEFKRLRDEQALDRDSDYILRTGQIMYSRQGVKKALDELGMLWKKGGKLPGVDVRGLCEIIRVDVAQVMRPVPKTVDMRITRVPQGRLDMLEGVPVDAAAAEQFPGDGSIRVRSNVGFIVDAVIPCVSAGPRAWDFVGRCPVNRRECMRLYPPRNWSELGQIGTVEKDLFEGQKRAPSK